MGLNLRVAPGASMSVLAMSAIAVSALIGCTGPGPVAAPPGQVTAQANPRDDVEQMSRWIMEDIQRNRMDRQKERSRKQQEEAYDREMCVKAGYHGPDVDQCVEDSGAYRRSGAPAPTSER
jgi:hypothetical protein